MDSPVPVKPAWGARTEKGEGRISDHRGEGASRFIDAYSGPGPSIFIMHLPSPTPIPTKVRPVMAMAKL